MSQFELPSVAEGRLSPGLLRSVKSFVLSTARQASAASSIVPLNRPKNPGGGCESLPAENQFESTNSDYTCGAVRDGFFLPATVQRRPKPPAVEESRERQGLTTAIVPISAAVCSSNPSRHSDKSAKFAVREIQHKRVHHMTVSDSCGKSRRDAVDHDHEEWSFAADQKTPHPSSQVERIPYDNQQHSSAGGTAGGSWVVTQSITPGGVTEIVVTQSVGFRVQQCPSPHRRPPRKSDDGMWRGGLMWLDLPSIHPTPAGKKKPASPVSNESASHDEGASSSDAVKPPSANFQRPRSIEQGSAVISAKLRDELEAAQPRATAAEATRRGIEQGLQYLRESMTKQRATMEEEAARLEAVRPDALAHNQTLKIDADGFYITFTFVGRDCFYLQSN